MKPAAFDYARPLDLAAALGLLAQYGSGAAVLAGGQSLVPLMNLRVRTPERVIDINRVPGLDRITMEGGRMVIGAMARQSAILSSDLVARHAPVLREACGHVGHVPTRSRGTLGGSIVHGDPCAELPVACLALGAVVTIRSAHGTRIAPLDSFYSDASTKLKDDELVVSLSIPIHQPEKQAFAEFALGGKCIVCGALVLASGKARLALGGFSASYVVTDADTATAARQFREAIHGVTAMSDHLAGPEYRRHLALSLIDDLIGKAGRA